MPINTLSNTIVSAEDPVVSRLVTEQLAASLSTNRLSGIAGNNNSANNGIFTVTTDNNAVVDIGAGSGDVTSAGPTNIIFATGGNQSVVLASLTTSEINTAVLSNATVFNTDKNIYITGIDSSINSQYTIGDGGTYLLPVATNTVLGGVKVGSGLSITGDGTLSTTGGGGGTSYSISANTTSTSNAVSLTLSGSDGSIDLVNFVGGSNVTMARTDANTITVSSTSGGGLSTVSAGSGISVVQSGNTATVSVTTATTSVVGGIKVGSGLSITADGTLSSSGGGGSSTPEIVIMRYGTDNTFQTSTGGGLVSKTAGVDVNIQNPISNLINLSFPSYTTPPKSFTYYGQNAANNVWRIVPVPSASSFTMTGLVISGTPNPLTVFNSSNVFSLTISTTTAQASGTQPYLVIVIGF